MKSAAKFHLAGKELCAEPLHYTMCGLDDVYLLNGFKHHETKYGHGVAVEDADCLHQVIGLYLIQHRKALGSKDLRFLRKNLDLTQDELATQLGTTGQTIARYEKGQTEISGPVDKLIRFIYVLALVPEDQKRAFLEALHSAAKDMSEYDETYDEPVYFTTANCTWSRGRLTQPHEMGSRHP